MSDNIKSYWQLSQLLASGWEWEHPTSPSWRKMPDKNSNCYALDIVIEILLAKGRHTYPLCEAYRSTADSPSLLIGP